MTEGSGPYEAARATAKLFAQAGWAVVTGGGPGVMEAANRGCQEGDGLSVGFNIDLPHEQGSNPYIDIGMTFHHFYARKTMFVKAAEGFCVFPGGFGTVDWCFESLTLIQTGKVVHFPVVLYDSEYWAPLRDWVRGRLLPDGMVSADGPRVADADRRPCPGGRARAGELRVAERERLVQLRDLPSVDVLARDVDDPLAVAAARTVLARAREEIRAERIPATWRSGCGRNSASRGRRACAEC